MMTDSILHFWFKKPLSKEILFSVGLHLGVIVGFVFFSSFYTSHLIIKRDVYEVDLVSLPPPIGKPQKGIEKTPPPPKASQDLPQRTIEELKEIQPVIKTETKPMVQEKTEKKIKTSPPKEAPTVDSTVIEKEIADMKADVALENKIAEITESTLASLKDVKEKEKVGSKDGKESNQAGIEKGVEGGVGFSENYVMTQYKKSLRAHVLNSWNLPQWTISTLPQDIFVIVAVYVNDNGEVIRTEFEKSSDLIFYNQSVVRAIKRASPLPKPPAELSQEIVRSGILMRFSPQKID